MKPDILALWLLLIAGQALSAGNLNYQQESGYKEINPIYGDHPSKKRVYMTKAAEIGLIYGATKLYPEYEHEILYTANTVCYGFMAYDQTKGIAFKFEW